MLSIYSKRQWFIFILFSMVYAMCGMCIYMKAPFYPIIASQIGASAFQYSSYFSMFFSVSIIISPISGKLMEFVDPYVIAKTGIIFFGTANILFGFLNRIYDIGIFLTFSILISIFESYGYTTFIAAAFSIIAEEFLDDIGTVIASFESCLATGLFTGPIIGGVLYENGGFTLPFLVTGLMVLAIGAITIFIEPSKNDNYLKISYKDILPLVMKPECLLAFWTHFAAAFTDEFVSATLNYHLNYLNLSESRKCYFFGLFGFFFCLFCPLWGRLLDSGRPPHIVWSVGAFLICISLIFLGPAPYLNTTLSIPFCYISLILLGIGLASQFVSSYFCVHKVTIYIGFPENICTYGMVFGLINTCVSLGGIFGPLLGGFLYDTVGLPWGFHVIISINILLILCTILYSFSPGNIFKNLMSNEKQELGRLIS